MWTSLPNALVVFLFLSNGVSASQHKRVVDGVTALTGKFHEIIRAAPTPTLVHRITDFPIPARGIKDAHYPRVFTGTGTSITIVPSGQPPGTGTGNYTRPHHSFPPKASSTSSSSSSSFFPAFTLPPKISVPPPAYSEVAVQTPKPFTSAPTIKYSNTSFIPSPTFPPSNTSSTPTPGTLSPSPTDDSSVPFLRGVNLGGWLVLEKWMNDEAFTGDFSEATDQYSFDSISGSKAALEKHWSSFITESDIQEIAATGINALRIPIGYWAYDNSGTPYKKGADAYLEKAIGWARNAGMKVWVDCHGSPGSQNGYDNSGRSGNVQWQESDNMDRSISVLKTMARKYGAEEYADVVVGLQLVNEPISWGKNDLKKTKSWAQDAYKAVKEQVENKKLVVVMHDSFEGGMDWAQVAENVAVDVPNGGSRSFGVDEHLYQLFSDSYNAMDQSQHITAACGWASNLAKSNAIMPTYVGEWSAATNICVQPDGSTTAGTSCSAEGCQCQSDDWTKWNDKMIEQIRRFVEAQLDVFESSSSGYFIWAAKGPGGWGFLNGIANGAIPNPITDRKYPGQCGSSGSDKRSKRNALGLKAWAKM